MSLTPMLISLPRLPRTLGCVPRVAQPSPLQSGQLIISYRWASRHLQSSLVCLFSPSLGLGGKRNGKGGQKGDPGHWLPCCDVTQRVGGGETNIPFCALHPSARGWGPGNMNLSLARAQTSTPALVQEFAYHPIRILSIQPPSSLGSWTQALPTESLRLSKQPLTLSR